MLGLVMERLLTNHQLENLVTYTLEPGAYLRGGGVKINKKISGEFGSFDISRQKIPVRGGCFQGVIADVDGIQDNRITAQVLIDSGIVFRCGHIRNRVSVIESWFDLLCSRFSDITIQTAIRNRARNILAKRALIKDSANLCPQAIQEVNKLLNESKNSLIS